ncbi:MAG: metallophosphoesterase family protein, partial [Ignisphaera sp.]
MKLIAISDIHGYVDRLREVLARENDVEVIVFSGDIAPYRNHLETLNSLKRLLSIAKNFNIGYVVAVPGNVDYINHYKQLEDPTFIYIHEECERIKDVLFIGFGGSTITPFNTILEYSEEDIYRALQSVYTKCKGKTTL